MNATLVREKNQVTLPRACDFGSRDRPWRHDWLVRQHPEGEIVGKKLTPQMPGYRKARLVKDKETGMLFLESDPPITDAELPRLPEHEPRHPDVSDYFDTPVLVYACGKSGELGRRARKLIARVLQGSPHRTRSRNVSTHSLTDCGIRPKRRSRCCRMNAGG